MSNNMKRETIHILFLFLIFTLLSGISVLAEDEVVQIDQITTHPAMDFSPAVSPDGLWIAFTSQREGNLDIWVKPLPRGRAVQVTTHKAEDSQPCWSPDGKQLAFVSKRSDAQGDIWLVRLDLKRGGIPKGEPVQITYYLGLDRSPAFSRSGRSLLFASDRDGLLNLWMVELDSRQLLQLTKLGGTDPVQSPQSDWILFTSYRFNLEGDLCLIHTERPEMEGSDQRVVYPVTYGNLFDGQGDWSPDGREIVFLRFDRDTNGDGVITPEDNGSLWQKQLVEQGEVTPDNIYLGRNEIQITTEVYREGHPSWGLHGEIFFSSDRGGGIDIWSIPSGGLFQHASSAEAQYGLVLDRFGEAVTEEALYQSVLGYQRVRDYFPEDFLWCARSLLQIGEIYHVLGQDQQSKTVFESVYRDYASQEREAGLAGLKMATISDESLESRIERCEQIIESDIEDPSVLAETWIVLGDLYREAGESGQSLVSYNRVLQSFPQLRNYRAQTLLNIGDLLSEEGQEETAFQSYIAVLREFEDIPLWRQRAGERILNQIEGSPQEQIRGYQETIQNYSELASLVAEAQLAIGRTLLAQNQYEQAVRELEQLELMVPMLLWAHAESKILQAEIYGLLGDELKGVLLLEQAIKDYGSVEGGRFGLMAEEELFRLLFRSAERLKQYGELAFAEARYRKCMTLQPDNLSVHRGLVEVVYQRGGIDSLIEEYEAKLRNQPTNPIFLYGLGLAYSYLGERNISQLERSNRYLQQALDEDYRLIYPYRTLSFNYELMEKLEEEQLSQKPGFLIRAGRTILAPLRWLIGLLPFTGDEVRVGYYEQAIEALMTAMELNDEAVDPQMEALLAQNLANNFYNLGEFGYKRAYQYYQLRLSLDTTFTSTLEKAVFFERAGHCGVVLEDIQYAVGYLQTAIQIYTDMGREEDVNRNLKMLAFLYHLAEQYEEAIPSYERALVQDEKWNRSDEVALGYRNIAYNYHLMGEAEDALKYARKAEAILTREEIPVNPPEKSSLRVEIFGFSIPVWGMEEIGEASAEGFALADEAAFVYGLISRSLESMKSYHEAIEYEFKRLDIFQRQKNGLAERITLNSLGRLYFKSSDYMNAWACFYRAWDACQEKEDERGVLINAINLGNVAIVETYYLDEGAHLIGAIQCLGHALDMLSVNGDGFTKEKLSMLNALGTLYTLSAQIESRPAEDLNDNFNNTFQSMQSLNQARSYFQEGLVIAQNEGLWREEGILSKNMAEITEQVHEYRTAFAYLEESKRLFEQGGEEELLWRVLYSMANIQVRLSKDSSSVTERLTDPLVLFSEAMDQLENLHVQEEGSEERLSDRDDRWHLYVDAAFEMVGRGMKKEALESVERGREKQIADILARHPPALRRERDKVAWGNVRYLRSRLQEIRSDLLIAEESQSRYDYVNDLKDQKERYENEYRQLMESLQTEDSVLAYLAGAYPVNVDQVCSALPSDHAVFSYLIGREGVLLWIVNHDGIEEVDLDIHPDLLEEKIDAFLERVELDSSIEDLSGELYDILLKPADRFIDDKLWIAIIPDGFLWDLPFGVLSDQGEPLIEKSMIYYIPSLTAYPLAWDRRKINQGQGLWVGDLFDNGLVNPMEHMIKQSEVLSESQATESMFRETVQNADVVQVQKGLLYSESDPLNSALVLFPGGEFDGFVRTHEIFSLDLRASLFVLPPSQREGYHFVQAPSTFYYALLYTGVPSAIMPLWNVRPEANQLFFETFYRHLNNVSVTEALADAQMVTRDHFPEIKAWGGFRVMGFHGMNAVERVQFAQNNMITTVLKGRAYEEREEYVEAIDAFEQALSMAEAMGDSSNSYRIYDEIRRVSVKGELWDEAVSQQMHLKRLAEKQNDSQSVRSSLERIIAYYKQDGQFDKAAEARIESIQLLQEEGSKEELISAYEDLAIIYYYGREYEKAVDEIDRVCRFYETENDLFGQGRTAVRKGRFYLDADEYWKASESLLSGIEWLQKGLENAPNEEEPLVELASAYQLLGLSYEKLTRYSEALDYQQKALDLSVQLDRPTQTAQGYQYLANLYWAMGDYRSAYSHQAKALEAFESSGDVVRLIMGYSTQGLIYYGLGELTRAKEAEQKALDLAEETERLADQATILKNMGMIYIQERDFDRAYDVFFRASQIDSSLGFRRGLAYDYWNLGNLLVHEGRIEGSIPLLRQSLEISREIGDKRNEVQTLYGLGKAQYLLGNHKTALAILDTGIVAASNLVIPERLWRLYRQRALVLSAMGEEEDALADFQNAIEIVERLRAELKIDALQQGFLDDKMDLYVDVVDHLVKMNRVEEGFRFVERAKSRSFIDLLGNQRLNLVQAQGALLEQEKEAQLAIQEAQDWVASFALRESNLSDQEREEMGHWQEELEERRSMYEAILISIQTENPELASFVSVDPWDLISIQGILPDSTALVEYYLTDDVLFCWVVSQGELILKSFDVQERIIQESVIQFRENIQANLSTEREGRQLYAWLLEPLVGELEQIGHLIIIPHGILHYLPFAALQNNKGEYVIERFSLSYAPSATVFGYCIEKERQNRVPEEIGAVLALSNPDLRSPLYDLPFAEKEVKSLQRVYDDVSVWSGNNVNERVVRDQIGSYRIVHFACHGTFEPQSPLFSALLLTPEGEDDGRLEAHEIFGLDLQCDLVTLSACETGLAEITEGDEIIGLSRSFIFAGTPSIITSLWKVDDLATSVMVKRFYRYYHAGYSKAEALRMAQLVVKESVNGHPAAWAAFGLTGAFQ